MRVSGFFFFVLRPVFALVLGCSFQKFGKNYVRFSVFQPFSAIRSHRLPKWSACGRVIPSTMACAEESFDV